MRIESEYDRMPDSNAVPEPGNLASAKELTSLSRRRLLRRAVGLAGGAFVAPAIIDSFVVPGPVQASRGLDTGLPPGPLTLPGAELPGSNLPQLPATQQPTATMTNIYSPQNTLDSRNAVQNAAQPSPTQGPLNAPPPLPSATSPATATPTPRAGHRR